MRPAPTAWWGRVGIDLRDCVTHVALMSAGFDPVVRLEKGLVLGGFGLWRWGLILQPCPQYPDNWSVTARKRSKLVVGP